MPATKAEIDSFHQFALDRLANGTKAPGLDELLVEWHVSRDREAVNEIIRQGLRDIEAGRGRDADEVMRELRRKHGLVPE